MLYLKIFFVLRCILRKVEDFTFCSTRKNLKSRYTAFCTLLFVVSANSFADSDVLLLPNTVIQNGCTHQNLGIYNGVFEMVPVYEDATTECNPGYYSPNDSTECVICAENHYCTGGDATMQSCPNNLVSPAGTTNAEDCGVIMRVGEDMLYLTQRMPELPALAVKIDGTVFYAKTTPVSKGEKPMNINTEHSLRMKIDGIEYSIHDITIKGD